VGRRASFVLLLLVLVVIAQDTVFSQCVMCRTALEQSAEGKAMAGSFRWGILLLLGAPYAIFGTVAFVFIRAYRRKKAAANSDFGFRNSDLGDQPFLYGVPKSGRGTLSHREKESSDSR
jgi:hypothetical protein